MPVLAPPPLRPRAEAAASSSPAAIAVAVPVAALLFLAFLAWAALSKKPAWRAAVKRTLRRVWAGAGGDGYARPSAQAPPADGGEMQEVSDRHGAGSGTTSTPSAAVAAETQQRADRARVRADAHANLAAERTRRAAPGHGSLRSVRTLPVYTREEGASELSLIRGDPPLEPLSPTSSNSSFSSGDDDGGGGGDGGGGDDEGPDTAVGGRSHPERAPASSPRSGRAPEGEGEAGEEDVGDGPVGARRRSARSSRRRRRSTHSADGAGVTRGDGGAGDVSTAGGGAQGEEDGAGGEEWEEQVPSSAWGDAPAYAFPSPLAEPSSVAAAQQPAAGPPSTMTSVAEPSAATVPVQARGLSRFLPSFIRIPPPTAPTPADRADLERADPSSSASGHRRSMSSSFAPSFFSNNGSTASLLPLRLTSSRLSNFSTAGGGPGTGPAGRSAVSLLSISGPVEGSTLRGSVGVPKAGLTADQARFLATPANLASYALPYADPAAPAPARTSADTPVREGDRLPSFDEARRGSAERARRRARSASGTSALRIAVGPAQAVAREEPEDGGEDGGVVGLHAAPAVGEQVSS